MKDITMEEFLKLNPKEIQLVDVRETNEFDESHIDGATNIPKGNLVERLWELDKSKTLYVMCKSWGRSAFMGQVMENHGFDVINILGGNDEYLKLTWKSWN